MSGVRSAAALRRLYERYRTATTLKTSARKPGEWLVLEPGSEDAGTFEHALGVGPASERAEAVVRELVALNGALGVFHEKDVRIVAQRSATRGVKLEVRFVLVANGKTTKGSKPTPRAYLPAVAGQLNLDQRMRVDLLGAEKVDTHAKRSTSSGTPDENDADSVSDVSDGTPMCLPDGTPIPDLSAMLMPHELAEAWQSGKLADGDMLDVLFAGFKHLLPEITEEPEEVDVDSMVDRFRARAILASGTPPIETSDEHPRGSWEQVSQDVVAWVKRTVGLLRNASETGHMLVLAPSPGTGKSRGMMEAAEQEQVARRRVGYAVLSRAQIPEAAERLRSSGMGNVTLIVVEGRHNGNCLFMGQVTVATNAGFSPGSTVCPSCQKYPTFGGGRNVCGYYQARKDASTDRFMSKLRSQAPAIILTTHASAVQGSHITKRRYQSFWEFDTLFIDEDPTDSMVQQHEITEETLSYSRRDHKGNLDGPTYGTLVLRAAMTKALRDREEAAEHGFVDASGAPNRIHTRDHGSTFAGGDLHALLEPIARAHHHTLKGLASAVIDGMTGSPAKGEIMNLDAVEVAARFPNRYLAPLFAALDVEITSVAEARAAGMDLEPAYRVHLDLMPSEDGLKPVFRVHELRGYANGRTNLVIGDAYGDVVHYEGLFGRTRSDNKVQVIKHRAVWPRTSTLIRVVTRAGTKHLGNHTQLVDHLEVNVRPVLELERGRRVLFYVHKAMKSDLGEWLESVREYFELGEIAIEHWGSGRGKDIYRDFNTLIAVSEFIANVGGLAHEANTLAALAAPGNTRVAHWNGYSPKKGSMGFANSLGNADPFYQAAFHRKTTDELAQAVHRVRPAMAPADGRQKRVYVFGHQVPWSDELIAATSMTVVDNDGKDGVDLGTEALGRGARFSITGTLGLVSEREVAGAVSEVFRGLGCWSHAFAHALVAVPSWDTIEDLILFGDTGRSSEGRKGTFLRDLSEGAPPSSVSARVLLPPNAWASIAQRLHDTSKVYRAGRDRFLAELPFPAPRRHRAAWMPNGSHGYEFWGDRDCFEKILNDHYGPIPF
jgi:hypothetical protein